MSEAWKGGSTRAWRKTRARVLLRDGYRCRLQLHGCTGQATHAHHTLGLKATGLHDLRFLVAACEYCNLATGDPTRNADPQPKPRTRW